MKFNGINQKLQNELVQKLETAEDKSAAIIEVVEALNAEAHKDLIEQLQAENEQFKADQMQASKLGIRTVFTKDEKTFYDGIMKQSITADQIDIIPTTIIDRTLADIKEESTTLKLVNFAPAGVSKWLTGSKTGAAAWGSLTSALTAELTATITAMPIEVHKLHVLEVIPKAVRDLAMPFVDKYFVAILNEAMHDGLVDGFINGNGVTAPIGILNKLPNSSGTVAAKTVNATLTGFTDTDLGDILVALSKSGKRKVNKLYLIANPVDVYKYVNPAIRYFNGMGYVNVSAYDIEVIEEPMIAQNKAILTIENAYTMGLMGVKVDEYKETKAVDDADLIVAKAYGNGRPDDDNTAYVFNPTKLVKYVPEYKNTSATA